MVDVTGNRLQHSVYSRIRKSRVLNMLPRMVQATKYFNRRYVQIAKWAVRSREHTNYTYDLTSENLMYLAFTIAAVTGASYEQIAGFVQEARNDESLKTHIIERVATSGLRFTTDARCEFGRRLGWYAVVRAKKPKVVVETGVDKGRGAVLLCSALLRNGTEGCHGRYYGTDSDREAGYLLSGKYKEVGAIMYGDSIESLRKFDRVIDIFINDSDHSPDYEYREYLTIRDRLGEGAIILGDNSHASDRLARFSRENHRKFLFFQEVPKDHWYPGAGIGISF